jgi:hypothetical protein
MKKMVMTDAWWNAFSSLEPKKMEFIKPIIHANDFSDIYSLTTDKDILNVLEYYTITRDEAEEAIKTKGKSVGL